MRHLPRAIASIWRRRSEKRVFAFLEQSGTRAVSHYHQSLFDHLRGTYGLLRSWGCSDDVCYAGLLHSIYGTRIFRHQSISYARREDIRALIGQNAEKLVYLFSQADRPQGLLDAFSAGVLNGSVNSEKIAVTEREAADLIAIECANLLDQEVAPRFADGLIECAGFPEHVRSPLMRHRALRGD